MRYLADSSWKCGSDIYLGDLEHIFSSENGDNILA